MSEASMPHCGDCGRVEHDCGCEYLSAARLMWSAYSQRAGGVTFDGKPLPTWDELGDDRRSCWMAAADMARAIYDPDYDVDS